MEDDKTATPAEDKKEEKKDVEVPEKFKQLVEEVEKMSVLDLAELVKILEDKFGVSAAAPAVAVAAAPGAGAEGEEEQTEFNVELKDFGEKKVPVIKAVKELTGKGLKEAKEAVEKKGVILEGVPKDKADEAKKKLEEAGATVEIK